MKGGKRNAKCMILCALFAVFIGIEGDCFVEQKNIPTR